MTISSVTPFTFQSADFAFWAVGNAYDGIYSTQSVTVDGYYKGNLVGADTLDLGVAFATPFTSSFGSSQLDELVINNGSGGASLARRQHNRQRKRR